MALEINISHSVLPIVTSKRYPGSLTVGKLKDKLYMIVGTSPEYQKLKLQDKDGNTLRVLQPDDATLQALGVTDNAYIHVVDEDPMQTTAQFTDTSKVEKYEISEEAYSKRKDNFRNFKKNFLKDKVEEEKKQAEERERRLELEEKLAKDIKVGARCEVKPGPQRGTVMYVGPVGAKGYFVGIKLDEPTGKNDGSLKGKKYFDCPPKYGLFSRPSTVTVGDFPEKDPFDDDSSDEDVEKEL